MFSKNLLKKVLSLQSESGKEYEVVQFISECAEELELTVESDKIGNLYITKGVADLYPCFVAHMDTVHDRKPNKHIVEKDGVLYAYTIADGELDQIGTGGDDLVGVFLALSMLKHLDTVKVAFFVQEEVGCIGSGDESVDKAFFSDCRWLIQADRRGNNEVITNGYSGEISSKEFQRDIAEIGKKYGYKLSSMGSWTDVVELQTNIPLSCANIGAGYYHAHSSREVVVVRDVSNMLDFASKVVEKMTDQYDHAISSKRYSYYGNYTSYYDNYGSFDYGYGYHYTYADAEIELGDPWWWSAEEFEYQGEACVRDENGDIRVIEELWEEREEEIYDLVLKRRAEEIEEVWNSDEEEDKDDDDKPYGCIDCNAPVAKEYTYCESCVAGYEKSWGYNPNTNEYNPHNDKFYEKY